MLIKAFRNIVFSCSLLGLIFQSCEKTSPSAFQKNEFIKFYSDAYMNEAVDMVQVEGLIYLLVNHTDDKDNRWVVLRCVDAYGNVKWEERYGNQAGDENNWANALVLLSTSNLAIIGTAETDQDTLFTDVKLTIIDKNNNRAIVFDSVYNDSLYDEGFCFTEQSAGGYLILGTKRDVTNNTILNYRWVLDNDFNITTPATIGETKFEMLGELEILNDGRKFLPGNLNNIGGAAIIELEDDGKWVEAFPAFGSFQGFFAEVDAVDYPKMVTCGFSESGTNGGTDAYLSIIDFDGQSTDWSIDFGGNGNDDATSMIYTNNNNILMTGKQTLSGHSDIYVLQVNNEGVPLDTLYFGGQDNEYSTKILPDLDNPDAFLVFGTSSRGDYSFSVLIKSKF